MSAMSFKQVSSIVEARNVKISLWVGAVSAGKTIASLFALLGAIRAAEGTGLIVIMGQDAPDDRAEHHCPVAGPAPLR